MTNYHDKPLSHEERLEKLRTKSIQEQMDELIGLSFSINKYAPKMSRDQRYTAFYLANSGLITLADIAEFFNVTVHTISVMKTHRHKYVSMKQEYRNLGAERFKEMYVDKVVLDDFTTFLVKKKAGVVERDLNTPNPKAVSRAGERNKQWISTMEAYCWPSWQLTEGWGYESSDDPGVVKSIEGVWCRTSQEAYDEIKKYV